MRSERHTKSSQYNRFHTRLRIVKVFITKENQNYDFLLLLIDSNRHGQSKS